MAYARPLLSICLAGATEPYSAFVGLQLFFRKKGLCIAPPESAHPGMDLAIIYREFTTGR